MKVKRFFAPDMSAAMRLVRDEVGPDAVILSNNRVAGGVEVVVGLEYEAPAAAPARRPTAARPAPARERAGLQSELGRTQSALARSQARPQQEDLPPLLRAVKDKQLNLDDDVWDGVLKSLQSRKSAAARTPSRPPASRPAAVSRARSAEAPARGAQPVARARSEARPAAPVQARKETPAAAPARQAAPERAVAPQRPVPAEQPELQAMREEIESLKSMLRSRFGEAGGEVGSAPAVSAAAVAGLDAGQAEILARFERMGLSSALGQRLVRAIESGTEEERGWKIALSRLTEALPTVGENIADRGGILAFVGATGVGKTTTIGKLAAQYVLKHGSSSVALVTTDTYRIAAHEQLRTFGRILDIPVRVVDETRSLDDVLRTLRDKRLVLVDTSGIGGGDAQRDQQLEMLSDSSFRIKKYLVLPTTAQYQVLKRACDHFKPVGLNGAVLSKVDESVSLGEAISAVIGHRLPVAYVADGQKIPDHIEVARANVIVSRAVVMAEKRQKTEEVDADQQAPLYAHAGDVV